VQPTPARTANGAASADLPQPEHPLVPR